jgi:cysteine desulfurase
LEPMRIYLDHNATTPLDARVRAAVVACLDRLHGNPSSVHQEGRLARDAVESARRAVAAMLGGAPQEVVFTSGGTEADVLGVVGLARSARTAGARPVVVLAAIEHPAVHGAALALRREGFDLAEVAVDRAGRVDPDDFAAKCRSGAAVAAVALANHELGTIQDIGRLGQIAHESGVAVHCDAVQAAGKLDLAVASLGADAVAISAHKLRGPKGAGALWVHPGRSVEALIGGGHQERELRPGTENLPGIVGFGVAAELIGESLAAQPRVAALRDRLQQGVVAMGARVHGAGASRVANTLSAAFPGVSGEIITTALDLAGIAASTGAACSSGSIKPSPVLLALGLTRAEAAEGVRFSLGVDTTDADIEAVLAALPTIVDRGRRHG